MPQREFWTERHECSISFEFRIDPTLTRKPPRAAVWIKDQASVVVRARSEQLPPTIAEDAFSDLVRVTMQTWTLADADAAVRTFERHARMWRRAAEDQAQTR